MPDPAEPNAPPPPPPAAPSGPATEPSSMDLPPNVAAAIACIPLVGGLIFYFLEKRNSFVRFYAMQSIIFGLAWLLFNIVSAVISAVFGAIPALGNVLVFFWSIIAALVHIAFVVFWIIATVKAFTGAVWEIPYVGPMARKQIEGKTPTL
jgi:uncharacterized membrane protein